ncbi:mannose binding [Homalodisca vitripennis]|nr:mannose binding [Homalodisca vitripennis]
MVMALSSLPSVRELSVRCLVCIFIYGLTITWATGYYFTDINLITSQLEDKQFHINSSLKASWADALRVCKSLGMKLAAINSKQEQILLEKVMDRKVPGEFVWTSGRAHKHKGKDKDSHRHRCNRRSTHGIYWKSTGARVCYSNWDTDEPDVFGEYRCLEVNDVFKWWIGKCSDKMHFVCELIVVNDESKHSTFHE